MNNKLFREESLPFIIFNNEKRLFELNQECIDFIKTIPAPIGVITVAGLYRTGKSYLLNRMLLNKSSGFGVGPTVNACTKGLWVWGSPLKGQSAEGEMMNILIIDSEGIGSLNEDQTHDTRIFSLAILLGSCFIYNSVGSIDENAIQNLSLVVNLTKHIHIKSNNEEVDSEDYSVYFPNFYWVIRDFSLQLLDQENEPITSKEYLEKALAPQKGFSDEVEQKNRIRRLLTSFFKERECITLVRPVVNEENLQKLDQIDLDQLRPEFFEQVMGFRKKVLTRCKAKTLNGKELNGEMFVSLTKSYLQAINQGAVPNIENAWSYLCKNECHKAELKAFEFYERGLKDNIYPRIPTSQEEIKFQHKQLKEQAVELFKKQAVGEVAEEYLGSLLKAIKQRVAVIQQQNEKESFNSCTQLMTREFASIDRKLKLGEYKFYLEYERDVKLFHQFLIEHGPKLVNRKVVYLDFISQALGEGSNFFIKNLQSEIEIQRSFCDDIVKKTDFEFKEMKDEYVKEKQEWVQKLHNIEKQNAELQINEQRNQDLVLEYQESKLKQEQELTFQLQKLKSDMSIVINQLKEKLQQKEEGMQQLERDLLLKQSEFNKEKALLQHKADHFEKMVQEYSQKERLFDTSLTNKTSEMNIQMKDQTLMYEKTINDLQQSKMLEQEKSQSQIQSLQQTQRSLENQVEDLKALSDQLNDELQKQVQDSILLKNDLLAQYSSQERNSDQVKTQLKEQMAQLMQEKKQLLDQLAIEKDAAKNCLQEQKKSDALLNQKNEFLQSQFNDLQAHLQDIKRQHEHTLQALELNSNDQLSKVDKKQIGELKDQHAKEIGQLKNEIQQIRQDYQTQLEVLIKEKEDADLKFRMMEASLQDEIRELQEALQMTERQKDNLEIQIKDVEECTKLSSQGLEQKYIQRIGQLEDSLLSLKEKIQSESIEMQAKSEESLAQLKNFYELEKERLENRINEEKKKAQNNYNTVVEEYEQRLKDEQSNYEEEIDQLKENIREYESQIQNITSQYEHELDLKLNNIENLELYYKEAKDQLNNLQQNHALQMEQFMHQINSEKTLLNQKIDFLSLEFKKKEKDLTTCQQKREHSESTLQRREEYLEQSKNDHIKEKEELNQKLEESRHCYNELQNQFLEDKITYEKNIALSTQQNEFFGAKVKELEKQIEHITQKYEDRIKNQKQECTEQLNEKLGKVQQEKQTQEIQNEQLRKNLKEEEIQHSKLMNQLERDRAVVQEKLSNTELKLKEIEQKYQQDIQNLSKFNKDINETVEDLNKKYQSEIEILKKNYNQLDQDKHDLINLYDRDKVLWDGKIQFLEQQRDYAKQEFQENLKKFEQTLQHMKQARQSERAEFEIEISEKLSQQEKRNATHIQEINENHQIKIKEYIEKLKKVEKELKLCNDKQLLEQQSKHNNSYFTEKKFHEMLDNEKKLLADIEKLKSERELRGLESQKEIDKIKDTNKVKTTEQDEKYRDEQKKRQSLIFEHEKERARWNQEKDHLLQQKIDLADNINKLQKKQEMMTRENERLKNDSRQQKRSHLPQVGTSFLLNASRNMSSDRKSPISNRGTVLTNFNKERTSYNDYPLINNSIDMTNKNYYNNNVRDSEEDYSGKENIPKSVLSEINNEQQQYQQQPEQNQLEQSNNINTGFKSFQLMMQEKTPERPHFNQKSEQNSDFV